MSLDPTIFKTRGDSPFSTEEREKMKMSAQTIVKCEVHEDQIGEVSNEADMTHDQELDAWNEGISQMC